MPIYAYKCESCGHQKDVLQKVSDAPLQICPACAAPRFVKQLTAAGFQLKGSGWYATDFRGGNKPQAPSEESKPADAAAPAASPASATATAAAPASETAKPAVKPATDKPRPPKSDAA